MKKETKNILFTNAVIIDPENDKEFKGEILVEDGIIKEVRKSVSQQASEKNSNTKIKNPDLKIIDCGGLYLAPGIVDAEVHVGEPGGSYKESIYHVSKSAVAGGVTTINIMPDTKPVVDATALCEFIKNRALEKSLCNITIFGSITKNLEGRELSEMGLLKKAGIKGVSDCSNYILDSLVFKRACEYASNFGLTVAHQPTDFFLSENAVINESEVSTRLGVQGNPDISEKIGLERDLAIIEYTGAAYHALNISSAKSLEALKRAKNNKLKVSASTTPEHISFTDSDVGAFRTYAKISPPLRSEKDKNSLIKALKEGVIDFIASNHSPRSVDQKRLPLQSAEFGVVGLETLFAGVNTALSERNFSRAEIFRLISLNPAKFLDLKDRGTIKKGARADIILIDFNRKWKVDPLQFAGKAVNSLFDGRILKGRIARTFISGELVYESK